MRSVPFVGLEMRGANPWQSEEGGRFASLSLQPPHGVSDFLSPVVSIRLRKETGAVEILTVRRPKCKRLARAVH